MFWPKMGIVKARKLVVKLKIFLYYETVQAAGLAEHSLYVYATICKVLIPGLS